MQQKIKTVAYIACAQTSEITAYRLTEPGALERIFSAQVPAQGVAAPYSMPLALDHRRNRLYAAIRSEPWQIASFTIEPTGALTLRRMSSAPGTFSHISVHPGGRHLLCASYLGEMLAVLKIEPD